MNLTIGRSTHNTKEWFLLKQVFTPEFDDEQDFLLAVYSKEKLSSHLNVEAVGMDPEKYKLFFEFPGAFERFMRIEIPTSVPLVQAIPMYLRHTVDELQKTCRKDLINTDKPNDFFDELRKLNNARLRKLSNTDEINVRHTVDELQKTCRKDLINTDKPNDFFDELRKLNNARLRKLSNTDEINVLKGTEVLASQKNSLPNDYRAITLQRLKAREKCKGLATAVKVILVLGGSERCSLSDKEKFLFRLYCLKGREPFRSGNLVHNDLARTFSRINADDKQLVTQTLMLLDLGQEDLKDLWSSITKE